MPFLERKEKALDFYTRYLWDEIIDNEGGIDRAQELLKKGIGGLFVPNHPFEPDGGKYVALLSQTFQETKINSPVAWHQYRLARILNLLAQGEVDLIPVVTPHTERLAKKYLPIFLRPERGKGLKKYLKQSEINIKNGGITIAPPQAERTHVIGKPDDYHKVLQGLFTRLRNIEFWVMPAGFYIGGKIPSEVKVSDWKHYVINIGKTYTKVEVLREVAERGISIDSWAFEKLKSLVPPGWRE